MPPVPPTDDELDALALTRYRLLGVDVSGLPVDDPSAPIDLRRLLANARATLRADAAAADFPLDPQLHVPALYPAPFVAWTEEGR
jgi:hypothetical protein